MTRINRNNEDAQLNINGFPYIGLNLMFMHHSTLDLSQYLYITDRAPLTPLEESLWNTDACWTTF
jgi:hypothetical protein